MVRSAERLAECCRCGTKQYAAIFLALVDWEPALAQGEIEKRLPSAFILSHKGVVRSADDDSGSAGGWWQHPDPVAPTARSTDAKPLAPADAGVPRPPKSLSDQGEWRTLID